MSDRIVGYTPNPSVPFRDLPLLVFPSLEVEVSSLNQEETLLFIITYRPAFVQNPSDSEIRVHLKLMSQSAIMDLLKLPAINWDDEVLRRNDNLVEPTNVSRYTWVDFKIWGNFYASDNHVVVWEDNDDELLVHVI